MIRYIHVYAYYVRFVEADVEHFGTTHNISPQTPVKARFKE